MITTMAITKHDKLQRMRAGPHLDIDGKTLVVPSQWRSDDASEFWEAQGFHYNLILREWLHNITKPAADGRLYSADGWLQAARRKFYEFYPDAAVYCRKCGQRISPTSRWTTLCEKCEDHHTGNWR